MGPFEDQGYNQYQHQTEPGPQQMWYEPTCDVRQLVFSGEEDLLKLSLGGYRAEINGT